jgi:peptidoglycan/LPS O-acetylase OafA/YrhL
VGAFSYGLYLFHQPYVLYAGERWRALPTLPYAIAATALIAALFVGARTIERIVGRLTDRVLA